ncbi:MAG: YbjQ family protein [Faecalibacterium sp.]
MLIVTTNDIPGKQIEALGVVRGSTVQSRNLGNDIIASFRTLVGGEINDYAEMLINARQIATGRMVKDAEAIGADAIVCMRYASSSVMQGAAEVIAYGTAVKFI